MNRSDFDEDIEVIEDEFLMVEENELINNNETKPIKKLDETLFEDENDLTNEEIENTRQDISNLNDNFFDKEKVIDEQILEKSGDSKKIVRYSIAMFGWLLFVTLTAIIMYVVMNEPDLIDRVINRIF